MVRTTSARPMGSSMAVGSSSTMHLGCMAMTPAMATRCFWPPESKWGACSRNSYMPTGLQCVVHPAADLLTGGPPDSPGRRPRPPPPHWPRSGCPDSETPCPRCAHVQQPRLVGGVDAVHIHLPAGGQQNGVHMLGQGGLSPAVVAQHGHKAALLNLQIHPVQHRRGSPSAVV